MILQNWWYTTLLGVKDPIQPPLKGDVKTDVLIVGGGVAGLASALRLMNTGKKVVLLERNICGGSSTGKSAGFLTPDSELELSQLLRRFGPEGARTLWESATKGVDNMVSVIQKYQIDCDLQKQDSLFIGSRKNGLQSVEEEAEARKKLGYQYSVYDKDQLSTVLGSNDYAGAIRYSGTYAVNPLLYAQGIKKILMDNGVQIYESSEVTLVKDHRAITHMGSVTADEIIFCADKLKPDLTNYSRNVYHAQTFLSISEPLDDEDVNALFPSGPLQCWDSELIYTYFRLTGKKRLLVGGGSIASTYAKNDITNPRIINHVIKDLKRNIPSLRHIDFIQYWQGRIDMTRDLLPTILRDKSYPWIHFVLGCVGLPWASFCVDLAARHVLDPQEHDFNKYVQYFSIDRGFLLPLWFGEIFGKRLVFTINNAWAKYRQVNRDKINFNKKNW